ncbi:androgen-induced gene 1 protein [Drosophila ficusphila]|uniref:androgen-induced gene 1 protein n=1 Tax=Drosophila ficusphila TaxID=30025 RepID=UPI001C89131A|nr:androgen-induced gene 1 protein [Drosophila ficusphila]
MEFGYKIENHLQAGVTAVWNNFHGLKLEAGGLSIHPEMERSNWPVSARKARLLLHLTASLHLGYAIYFDYWFAQLPQLAVVLRLEPPIGGKFKYMTFLGGIIQFVYYFLALTYDLVRLSSLRTLRDYMMASFVVPLSLTVSLTFWTLFAIDRESIYPVVLDLVYPGWLNHAMHTFVVVYALLELAITHHRYPSRMKGFIGLGLFMVGYLAWIHFVWWVTGIWVYPFLGGIPWFLRVGFFILVMVLGFVYYRLGEHINHVIWERTCKLQRIRRD